MRKTRYFTISLLLVLLTFALSGCGDNISGDVCTFYSSENNKDSYVLTSGNLELKMDGSTSYFTLTDKNSGEVWNSVPDDFQNDPLADSTMKKHLASTLILTYTNADGIETVFDNYSNSISGGGFEIKEEDGALRVNYLIGEQSKRYIIPEIISVTEFEKWTSGMEKPELATVKSIYKKIDPEKLDEDELKKQLAVYPLLNDGAIYVQRDGAAEYKYEDAAEAFKKAGYTYDDYLVNKNEGAAEEETLQYNVSVIYRLENEQLNVEIPADSIKYPSSLPVTSIQVLPYFGAGTTTDTGYLLMPDGGGAQIDFNARPGNADVVTSKMYGWDRAKSKTQMISENKASFPVFAIQKNDGYLLGIVDKGDAELTLTANLSGVRTSYNYIIPSFEIIHGDAVSISSKSTATVTVFEQTEPCTDISILYCPGNGDSYVDMALKYRDYLTKKYPDLSTVKDTEAPLAIELIGSLDHITQVAGIPMRQILPVTDKAEAENIINELNNSNINNIYLKYSTLFCEGMRQKSLQKPDLLTEVIKKEELSALNKKLSDTGGALYTGAYAAKVFETSWFDGFSDNSDAIRDVLSDVVLTSDYSKVTYMQVNDPQFNILNKKAQEQAISEFANYTSDLAYGIAFEDIGNEIASDFNKESHTSRTAMIESQKESIKSVKESGRGIIINTGNSYMAPYADFILNMDIDGNSYNLISRQVPVYQIALHGFVNYAGEAMNMAGDYKTNLLKSVETGAGMYALFAQISPEELQMTDYSQYSSARFEQWGKTLAESYNRLNNELGHTYKLKITDHKYLSDFVTCTTYEDGTMVYVNYNRNDVSFNGVTIPACDYVTIRR